MTNVLTPIPDRTGPGAGPRATRVRTRARRASWVALVAVLATASVGAEVALGASLRHAHAAHSRGEDTLARVNQLLRAVDAQLNAAVAKLAGLRHDIATRTSELNDASRALAQAQDALRVVKSGVASAAVQATANHTQISALAECLGGAQQAVLHLDTGDIAGATGALQWVQGACNDALTAAGGDGPVFPFDFADPFVLRVGSTYYAYSTNAGAGNVQVIQSDDMRHWQLLGNALPSLPAWAGTNATWAPSVLARNGYYVLYYVVPDMAAGQRCIASAVALAPQGPFVDSSPGPLVCRTDLGGAIDPSPLVDPSGNVWLLWRGEDHGGQKGAIYSAPLTPDGRALAGGPTALIRADQGWEQGVVEAPSMTAIPGGFALLYSGNDWNSRSYATGFAWCATPAGPCTKPPRGPVLASHDAVAGPGGAEFFTDPAGAEWIAYHAYTVPNIGYP
ncbi:MAG: family 43 glycosylhydrolase, partial [Actinobacteria bacterium]|nr:family 43 glycosylhydrolase [Actinomycetota bacterium]